MRGDKNNAVAWVSIEVIFFESMHISIERPLQYTKTKYRNNIM